jgi:hypothetical protein
MKEHHVLVALALRAKHHVLVALALRANTQFYALSLWN